MWCDTQSFSLPNAFTSKTFDDHSKKNGMRCTVPCGETVRAVTFQIYVERKNADDVVVWNECGKGVESLQVLDSSSEPLEVRSPQKTFSCACLS